MEFSVSAPDENDDWLEVEMVVSDEEQCLAFFCLSSAILDFVVSLILSVICSRTCLCFTASTYVWSSSMDGEWSL